MYKYFQIENFKILEQQLLEYISNNTTVLEEKLPWKFLDVADLIEHVPDLKTAFDHYSLEINVAAAVYRRPYTSGGIHVDSSEFYRVLLPVLNCEGSRTKFFKFDETKFTPGSGPDGDRNLSLLPGEKLEFLDQFELNQPVVFDPQIPHGVYTNLINKGPRVSLTLGFKKDPKDVLFG